MMLFISRKCRMILKEKSVCKLVKDKINALYQIDESTDVGRKSSVTSVYQYISYATEEMQN